MFDAEDAPGVSEFLEARNASLVHYVHSTSVPGLHLVPAGKLGHQPGAQLDAELRLLEEARSLADVVIIDTAPLLAASVTRELVTMADVVVLASRAGRTTSPAAERTAELLERLGAPTLGVALVGVPDGRVQERLLRQAAVASRPLPGLGPQPRARRRGRRALRRRRSERRRPPTTRSTTPRATEPAPPASDSLPSRGTKP